MCQKPQKTHPPFYVFLGSRSNYNKYDIIDMKHSPYTFTRSFVLAAVLVLQGVLASVAYAVGVGGAGMYQWSVELRGYISNETGKAPRRHPSLVPLLLLMPSIRATSTMPSGISTRRWRISPRHATRRRQASVCSVLASSIKAS